MTEYSRINFNIFIDTLATRLVYLSNGDRRNVLFRIYDAVDSHGMTVLEKALLLSGGFKAIGRLTSGAYPSDIEDASRIVRNVLIRAISPYSPNPSPYILDTASEYEEVSVQYYGFSPKIGRFGNEAAMTTNLRQQPPQRLERGIIPIPKGIYPSIF